MKPIIDCQNISYYYIEEEGEVIKNLNLSIEVGEWVCVLGPNGSGKSTLSKLIAGIINPRQGQILIDDELMFQTNYQLRRKIGMVFQNPDNQFVGSTVKDDIAFGLENNQIPQAEMEPRIQKYSALVGMQSFLEQEPQHLSGGEKQRVAIASVLALETEILLLDEATSMLDPLSRHEVLETITSLKKLDKTVISITHDVNEALLADRIIIMVEGQMVAQGTPREIFMNPELLAKANLEVLPSIRLAYELQKQNYSNKEVLDYLWEYPFSK
jgi:energy-coupling factor transport system ATP-binding protein